MTKMIDPSKQNKIWQEIKINETKYIILVIHDDNIWKVFLTDLIEIWTETLTGESIVQRCKELNPLLCIEEFDCNTTVSNLLTDITNQDVQATLHEIRFKSSVGGGIFKFLIKLTKGTPQELWENITKPLCLSSMELICRHKFLIDLIKKKDEEIAEYKAEGAELIRKNIETKVFNENQFKTEIPTTGSESYVNAFQRVMQFYNLVHFDQPTVKNEPESTSSNNSSDTKRRDSCDSDDSFKRSKKFAPRSKRNVKPSKQTLQRTEKRPTTSPLKKLKKRIII